MIKQRYQLFEHFKRKLRGMTPNFGFGIFGQIVYYRSYSRVKEDGTQEHWADTVIRVIEGIMSIRYDWYVRNNIEWDNAKWNRFAEEMALSMYNMQWLPPGRGLWAMGSPMMYVRGSMCLYNCAYTDIRAESWIEDLCWIKDVLMCGVGVGFRSHDGSLKLRKPNNALDQMYIVPDSREGWVDSVRALFESYVVGGHGCTIHYDYSKVRPMGALIRGFGGTASGPEPLRRLHESLRELLDAYCDGAISVRRLFTDSANLIGVCVVAGNIRRSAEIALGTMDDQEFLDLKNYDMYPERAAFGWMSNNSVILETDSDFDNLSEIASRVVRNGEPGYINHRNFKYGRLSRMDNVPEDLAVGINPCGEIPLEDKEVCNVADTLPTRCKDHTTWLRACEFATFYTSTVSMLPTHHTNTNAVVTRNHRIGVGIIDFAGWKQQEGMNRVIKYMRAGYARVKYVNHSLAKESGIRDSIRVTTIKPGGSTTKIAGRQPGIGHPNFDFMIRRIRVQKGHPIEQLLIDANIPNEPCVVQPDFTTVFELPIYMGETRTIHEVSLWEQAMNLVTVQREWADNAVSNTLVFKSDEKNIVEFVLSSIAPMTKSVSLLEYCTDSYKQMPEEGITQAEYYKRINAIKPIDWSKFRNSDGTDEKFCEGDKCSV